jgi:GntR family transcriptional repressor for pyruvate dehydrogenase complex
MLEVGAAGLAAERAEARHLHALAEEVAAMYAHIDDPQQYLVHDVQFHSAIAAASRNPVLATLVETVASLNYERRKLTVERAHDLKESAAMHRRIYLAIKAGDATRARAEMRAHLDLARQAQASEEMVGGRKSASAGPATKNTSPRRKR